MQIELQNTIHRFIIYFLMVFFIIIILDNMYNYSNYKEGFIKKAKKATSRAVNTVSETAKKATDAAAAAAKKAAEAAAVAAKKLAEELAIQNELFKLIQPINDLNNSITNSLNFMKQF